MANRPAPALILRDGDRERLECQLRSDRFGAAAARRARIVLLAADGVANTGIAELTGASMMTVLNWRRRYEDRGIAGLTNAPRPGRPRQLDHRQIVAEPGSTTGDFVNVDVAGSRRGLPCGRG